MKVGEYIKSFFASNFIQLGDADMISILGSLSGEEEVGEVPLSKIEVGIARFIPTLLLRPDNVSESGFSVSMNKANLRAFYNLMSRRYGFANELDESRPKISIL